MSNPHRPPLVLASTSRYRAALLTRLGLAFLQDAPDIDETPRPGESADALAQRLAAAKAAVVAERHPGAIVLASDQSAACAGVLLGKPGSEARALEQLRLLSGRHADFYTAVAVRRGGELHAGLDHTRISMRTLDDAALRRYIAAEPALDCAGSFKCEGLGITLFERIDSQDPTGLEGLPLILTARLLARVGIALP